MLKEEFKNIKLLVSDIDGTIAKKDHTTSPKVVETIEKCRDSGYLFGLASGRPVEDVLNKYQEWHMREQFDFIIGWNGCQLYDNKAKKTYQYNYLTKDELKEIVEFMSKYDCVITMYDHKQYLSSRETERAVFSAYKVNREFVATDNLEMFYKEDNGGIMFRTLANDMPEIEKDIEEHLCNKNYRGFKTQADLMEFANKDCNKSLALKKYCEMYDISLDDCMAFGDTSNDNELLACCTGICMLNGSLDTKACAKIITDVDCENDGWSHFVEDNLL